MFVVKRDGRHERVAFDKILKRVQAQCGGLEGVDPALVAQKTIGGMYNGVSTNELDALAAETGT